MQVYPIGISLADAAIVGVTLRLARGLGLGFAGGMSTGVCVSVFRSAWMCDQAVFCVLGRCRRCSACLGIAGGMSTGVGVFCSAWSDVASDVLCGQTLQAAMCSAWFCVAGVFCVFCVVRRCRWCSAWPSVADGSVFCIVLHCRWCSAWLSAAGGCVFCVVLRCRWCSAWLSAAGGCVFYVVGRCRRQCVLSGQALQAAMCSAWPSVAGGSVFCVVGRCRWCSAWLVIAGVNVFCVAERFRWLRVLRGFALQACSAWLGIAGGVQHGLALQVAACSAWLGVAGVFSMVGRCRRCSAWLGVAGGCVFCVVGRCRRQCVQLGCTRRGRRTGRGSRTGRGRNKKHTLCRQGRNSYSHRIQLLHKRSKSYAVQEPRLAIADHDNK